MRPYKTNRRDLFKMAGAAGLLSGGLGASVTAFGSSLPSPRANPKSFAAGRFPRGPVMAKGRVLGANDRLLIGHVGVGGMGTGHVKQYKEHGKEWNTQSIAVCDPYTPRIERAKGMILGDSPESVSVQTEKDYRKLLDNKDIDAVIVATPEHWHCQIGVHAVQAGKHAYVQKPMARYLDEGFQLLDATKRSGKIVQIGSQGTSDPKYHAVKQAVASGKLGPIVSAQTSYTRNSDTGEWNYDIEAGAGLHNLDWDLWLGSAPRRPWSDDSKARFFRYRKYRDYSAGILGDLMPHKIHPVLMALGGDSWPLKVQCLGLRNVSTDREVADTVHLIAEMEGGWALLFVGSTVNEQGLPEQIRGHKATLYMAGSPPEIRPERPFAEEIDGGSLAVSGSGDNQILHSKNWHDCIRENRQPNCNVDLAVRAQVLVSLAEISEMTKKTVLFDPARRAWRFA